MKDRKTFTAREGAEEMNSRVEAIIQKAKKARPKHNYFLYREFRKELEELCLSPKDYESAVKRLSSALGV